jgi:signal transduction histidine kinase
MLSHHSHDGDSSAPRPAFVARISSHIEHVLHQIHREEKVSNVIYYLGAAAMTLIALFVAWLLHGWLAGFTPFLLLIVAIMLSTELGGLRAGILSVIVGVVGSGLLLMATETTSQSTITNSATQLCLFFVLGLFLAKRVAALHDACQQSSQDYASAQAALKVRERLFSVAAHELKTPLTTLLGYIQMLQTASDRQSTEQQPLQIMSEQAIRLNRMVDMYLDLAYIETGRLRITPEPIELCAFGHLMVAGMRTYLAPHEVMIECPEELLWVQADAAALSEIFTNLLDNGAKYSPLRAPLKIRMFREGQIATVEVIDQGIGIPVEAQPLLFEPFFRADNTAAYTAQGMGIGLYVVRELVHCHGGSISVSSVEGKGATFTIHLPLQTYIGCQNPVAHEL